MQTGRGGYEKKDNSLNNASFPNISGKPFSRMSCLNRGCPNCHRRVEEDLFTLSGLGNRGFGAEGWEGWGGSRELFAHKEMTELEARGLSGAPPPTQGMRARHPQQKLVLILRELKDL